MAYKMVCGKDKATWRSIKIFILADMMKRLFPENNCAYIGTNFDRL